MYCPRNYCDKLYYCNFKTIIRHFLYHWYNKNSRQVSTCKFPPMHASLTRLKDLKETIFLFVLEAHPLSFFSSLRVSRICWAYAHPPTQALDCFQIASGLPSLSWGCKSRSHFILQTSGLLAKWVGWIMSHSPFMSVEKGIDVGFLSQPI